MRWGDSRYIPEESARIAQAPTGQIDLNAQAVWVEATLEGLDGRTASTASLRELALVLSRYGLAHAPA
jgi:hypothetical protein